MGGYIIVMTCDVGERVKGSVMSHTSHQWKGTINSQIHEFGPNSCCQLAVCVRTRNI